MCLKKIEAWSTLGVLLLYCAAASRIRRRCHPRVILMSIRGKGFWEPLDALDKSATDAFLR